MRLILILLPATKTRTRIITVTERSAQRAVERREAAQHQASDDQRQHPQ